MPVLRFTRDKRGYENTLVVDVSPHGGGPGRVLYWFRTPPGVRVGGVPLDVETRRLIEARHPELRFDWRQMLQAKPAPGGAPSPLPRPQGSPGPAVGTGRRPRRDRRAAPFDQRNARSVPASPEQAPAVDGPANGSISHE